MAAAETIAAADFVAAEGGEFVMQQSVPLIPRIEGLGAANAKYHNRLWPLAGAFVGKKLDPYLSVVRTGRQRDMALVTRSLRRLYSYSTGTSRSARRSVLAPGGGTKVMPKRLHGCFADHADNIWISGNADGLVLVNARLEGGVRRGI